MDGGTSLIEYVLGFAFWIGIILIIVKRRSIKRKNKSPLLTDLDIKNIQSAYDDLAERKPDAWNSNIPKMDIPRTSITDAHPSESAYHTEKYEDNYSLSLDEFKDSLSIVWVEDPIDIEFSYIDSSGNRTRRCILLHEVLINKNSSPYFYGLCLDAGDFRLFKVDRITSKIKHKSERYDASDFFEDVLSLDGVY